MKVVLLVFLQRYYIYIFYITLYLYFHNLYPITKFRKLNTFTYHISKLQQNKIFFAIISISRDTTNCKKSQTFPLTITTLKSQKKKKKKKSSIGVEFWNEQKSDSNPYGTRDQRVYSFGISSLDNDRCSRGIDIRWKRGDAKIDWTFDPWPP